MTDQLGVTILADDAVLIGVDPGEDGVHIYRSYSASPRWSPVGAEARS